jgi:UDPglucose 6-dehydrogenase
MHRVQSILDDRGVSYTFDVVSNPEFLKEWTAIDDFISTERIVCGYSKESSKKVIDELYVYFIQKNIPILYTDTASSELIKYASNTFLATKISFINELATFTEIVWADILDISKGMGLDSRIWKKFLQAGVWYWWSCFPKDVQALVHTWKQYGFEFKIPQAAQDVNAFQKKQNHTNFFSKSLIYLNDV